MSIASEKEGFGGSSRDAVAPAPLRLGAKRAEVSGFGTLFQNVRIGSHGGMLAGHFMLTAGSSVTHGSTS